MNILKFLCIKYYKKFCAKKNNRKKYGNKKVMDKTWKSSKYKTIYINEFYVSIACKSTVIPKYHEYIVISVSVIHLT